MSSTEIETTVPPLAVAVPKPLMLRWYVRVGLAALSVGVLTLAFAPFGQFYLGWIGLAPLLVVIAGSRSGWSAFLWAFLTGVAFFTLNMWWLWPVTNAGMIALMVMLGLYWAVPAMLLRGAGVLMWEWSADGDLRRRVAWRIPFRGKQILPLRGGAARVLAIAVVWVGFEWLRGAWPLHGLPWLFFGHSQSPLLVMCQIADVTGVAGISFLLVMANGVVALAMMRVKFATLRPAIALTAGCVAVTAVYGVVRFWQGRSDITPGPTVLVVQTNIHQSNTGEKGVSPEKYFALHWNQTVRAMQDGEQPDLAVWSETAIPPVNIEVQKFFAESSEGIEPDWALDSAWTLEHLSTFYQHFHIYLLTGGLRFSKFSGTRWNAFPQDRRNSAYLFDRDGRLTQSYDKVHLVPFGEYMPFEKSCPPLYRLLMHFNPYGSSDYTLTPGEMNELTVFHLDDAKGRDWRFVTPICFEDIDAPLVRKMLEPDGRGVGKRADFIVNLTNDGWFLGGENAKHLQASIFRAIENRTPLIRSVNTGVSGFVDSMGRTSNLIPARTEGTALAQVHIDSRTTLYTRFGNVFAWLCAIVTGILLAGCLGKWSVRIFRRRSHTQGE